MMEVKKDLVSPLNSEIKYFDMLNSIMANLVDDFLVRIITKHDMHHRKFLWIRHDVDHSLLKALDMAEMENDYGYRSTYFFLHTAPYWDSVELKHCVKSMQKLGHGIGLHHNVLWNVESPEPQAVFERELKKLEDISNSRIRMVSAHGNVENLNLWHYLPSEYLIKDAYHLRRDAYLSDSGHKWNGWIGENVPAFEFGGRTGMGAVDTINKFNAMPEGVMQLLVHPCWWEKE